MDRQRLRQVVLWVMAADFPLLYLGAVTLESTAMTVGTLAVMGVAGAIAALVY